jgi:NAD(P)-dependent dehydrogenase (short-subunit alcohol dehydrogenase family)
MILTNAISQVPYRASKTALHMITACQAYEYGPLGWKVFNFCPGFTESNMSPMNKVEHGAKPVADSVKPLIRVLAGERDAESGGYLNGTEEGTWPW